MTRADYFRFRTHVTGLTDDALFLLDALFQHQQAQRSIFFADAFTFHLNVGVPGHAFTDAEVIQLFEDWTLLGWVQRLDGDDEPYFSLTNRGMEIWESERLPVWDQYLTEQYDNRDHAGRYWLEIYAPTRKMAYRYLHLSQKTRRFRTFKLPRTRSQRNLAIPHGKVLASVHIVRVRVCDLPMHFFQREAFDNANYTWDTARQLAWLRLHGWLPWPL